MSNDAGIYMILNTATGDRYIGQSSDLYRRRVKHWRDLRKGLHHCVKLQQAWASDGEEVFRFMVLERCPAPLLTEREQWYFDHHWPEYNTTLCAEAPMRGHRHTPGAIEKIRQTSLGRKVSEETRARQREAQSARTPETIEKMRSAAIGRKHTPESIEKMRAAALRRTEEQRRAYGDMARNMTPEQKAAVAEGNRLRAKPLSDEHRAKISAGLKAHYSRWPK